MTNTQKRSLYESIMNDVAKIIKTNLNESYQSTKIKRFLQLSNEYYQELLKDPDHNYQILGKKGFFQLTKIIQIKAYDDITTDGVVHELINGNIWGNTKFASTITDEQCISNIMTNEQIIKNNIFKPQNRDRYFIICYSFGVRKGKTNRLEYGVNIDHIKYAMELNADAIKELTNEHNKHKQREQVKKQREQDKEDEYDKLRKDKMFDKSVDELGKKLYSKAVTAFDSDQINDVVSILNSLYYNGGDEDIIYNLVYLLNELI